MTLIQRNPKSLVFDDVLVTGTTREIPHSPLLVGIIVFDLLDSEIRSKLKDAEYYLFAGGSYRFKQHLKKTKILTLMETKTKHAHGMAHMNHSKKHNEPLSAPGAGHKRLQVFVGKWKTEGKTVAGPDAPSQRITATDTYEWLDGGFFLIHRVVGHVGDNKIRVLEVIEYDQEDEMFIAHSFDNAGTHNHMQLTFRDGAWLLTGESERSTLVVNNDGNTMTAKWERTTDGKNWKPWMVVTLTKET